MPDSGGQQKQPASWLPYAGFFLAMAGIVYQGGVLANQVSQQEARLVKLEARNEALLSQLTDMRTQSAVNGEKLNFLYEQAKEMGQKGRR